MADLRRVNQRMRLGIIGTGRIAARAVKEICNTFIVTAVVNPNLQHADEFIESNYLHGATNGSEDILRPIAFNTVDALSGSVDAVYIASPHDTHYAYAKAALLIGKHVLCEKPMTLVREQAEELYEIAADKGLILMEAIKTAYCPGFRKIEEAVSSGVIGEVVDVDAAFTRLTPYCGREYTDSACGGSFTEFGTYTLLPIFRFLGTDYNDVRFMSRPAGEGYRVDGYTRAIFDYGNRYASAKTGLTVKCEGALGISGTKGYVFAPSPWWLTRYFEVRHEDPSLTDRYECMYEGDGLRYEFTEFAKRIEDLNDPDRKRLPDPHATVEIEMQEAIARAGVFERFLSGR